MIRLDDMTPRPADRSASSAEVPATPLGAQLRTAPALDDIVDLECLLCPGLVDRVHLEEVRDVAREHLSALHPIETAALQASGGRLDDQWRGRVAVPVCDACYSILEPPYWDHTSTPPTHAGGFRDDDGGWLLCDQCHELRIAGRPGAWTRYVWTTVSSRYPWMQHLTPDGQLGTRAEMASTIRLLLERLDQGERLTL
jgi:hypothetical protein